MGSSWRTIPLGLSMYISLRISHLGLLIGKVKENMCEGVDH
jgi:hypothetical protein